MNPQEKQRLILCLIIAGVLHMAGTCFSGL
jgi:hypothetical protein